ncbi:alpha/beta hydrolase [Paenibacillus tritici]|uniref:Alpha/beta hydrolase n=1 Tax=Paenibacillus tritici TaxID=1873425 RepID=A0ABX2DKV4_9BACL|nr:alpha/beta hydrolase [Paenibacillus tritici]NQX44461.1 alpha/beta hydrolase [Paenibacillus tritici]
MLRSTRTLELENGTFLEYTIAGTGTPILLFHGGHSNCNEEFGYKNLLEQGYSIITPSRAGYGSTSKKLGLSLNTACEAYLQLINHLNVCTVHVIAISAGGPTGITFASLYPERVSSLVLQSAVSKEWHTPKDAIYRMAKLLFLPATEKYTWKLVSFFSRTFPNFILKQMVPSFSTLPVPEVLQQFSQEDIEQFVAMNQRQRSGHGFMLDLEQSAAFTPSKLQKIMCPTLIIHSKNDKAVLPEHALSAYHHIPESRLCLLDSWGHLIWLGSGARSVDTELNKFLCSKFIRPSI